MLTKVLKPIIFQGSIKNKHYFEGWYFKQVTADQKYSLSFIPGISLNKNDRHSFIQYILVETGDDGRYTTHTGYVRFDLRDFTYLDEPFAV